MPLDLWIPSDADLADLIELAGPDEAEMVVAILDELAAREREKGVWVAQPKQAIAETLSGEVDELLYGGSVGGGKSEWLMEHAIRECEQHPRNLWAIFRRVYPSLALTIIPRLLVKLAGGRATWNANDHTFTFPNRSVIKCSHLQVAATSHFDWYGAELGGVAFEELTEFEQPQYEYLLGRLRAPAPGIRPHAIATTNPGGRGHRWVKRRFIRPRLEDLEPGAKMPEPFEVWRQAVTDDVPEPLKRAFVPATFQDNPALVARDPGYLNRVIAAISDVRLRKALAVGDWDAIDAVEGAFWAQADLDGGRTDMGALARAGVKLRCVAVDPSDGEEQGDKYGVWAGALGLDGVVYTERSYGWRLPPRDMAENTIALAKEIGASAIVVERNHGGKWLRATFKLLDPYVNIQEVWASDGKRPRHRPIASMFARNRDDRRRPYLARLIGHFPELEEQMTTYTDATGEASPDELDACTWGHAWLTGMTAVRKTEMDDQRLRGRR